MAIKYFPAPEIEGKAKRIAASAGISRDFSRIHFVRSKGSKGGQVRGASKEARARKAHALPASTADSAVSDDSVSSVCHQIVTFAGLTGKQRLW